MDLIPYNLHAERSALGGMLVDSSLIDELVDVLMPVDFYRDSHQVLCGVIYAMRAAGKTIDLITVAQQLQATGQLEKVGGFDALTELVEGLPHTASTVEHGQLVAQNAVLRELIVQAQATIEDAMCKQYTAEEATERAESRLSAISDTRVRHEASVASDVVPEALARVIYRRDYGTTGIHTGLVALNNLIGGFQPEELIVIGARPSMGKTAYALTLANEVIEKNELAALFVSLEMGHESIAERLLGIRSRVDGKKIRTGNFLRDADLAALNRAANDFSRLSPLIIDDSPMRTVGQIFAHARRIKQRHTLGIVVIDYIQLVEPESGRDSRQEQIAKISRRLKTMARSLKVPVVALSQLNRAVEGREDKRPRMADLRESGAIEQDADRVLLLHRPEYYDPNDSPGVAEVIIAKNRNGETGTVKSAFRGMIGRFEDLDERDLRIADCGDDMP